MRKRQQFSANDIAVQLPVRPVAFAVLAALAEGAQPGFEVLERANAHVPRTPILGPGTLYRLLRELRRDGLIERVDAPVEDEGASDERRQYHVLTRFGRAVLEAEAARLRATLYSAGLLTPARGT